MHSTSATNGGHRPFRGTMLMAVAAAGTLIATAGTATAACGRIGRQPQAAILRQVPALSMSPAVLGQPAEVMPEQPAEVDSLQGIVGLWHVNYFDSTGAPFYESFDMWHSDGTEWETAYSDPRAGNYCLGVWTKAGLRTVQLNHVGWVFNPDGTQAGYFTMTETNTVSRSGDSYTGTFDEKVYDVNGNLIVDVVGTQVATRFKL